VEQQQANKEGVAKRNAAIRKSELWQATTIQLQERFPNATIDDNAVLEEALSHYNAENGRINRATARARYETKLRRFLKSKTGGKRVARQVDREVTKKMREVVRARQSWTDALKELNGALGEDAPDAQPAREPARKRGPMNPVTYVPSDSDESSDDGEREGEEHYEDDEDDEDDESDEEKGEGDKDGGGGGDEDDNPYKEEDDDAKDRDLVATRPECKAHVDHCADLCPAPTADGETTVAVGKNDAVRAHLAPFKRVGELPNGTWYVGDDPYTVGADDQPPGSGGANDLYGFGFLNASSGYGRADAGAWEDFYRHEMKLVVERQAYFDLNVSDAWSLGGLKQLWRATVAAHEDVNVPELELERVFAWRLTVVHLRALRKIGCDEFLPVTACFEMDALVDNVAHMLKYRRCVHKAKCLYTNAGMRSLHEQYRARLLNVQHAHHHQDESTTETGIARRIIRQAHVANYVHYYWYNQEAPNSKVYSKVPSNEQKLMLAERFTTNPPMAPLMSSAPPRSGKSALALLMASFAYKLGASVEYGVSPNKKIPVADVKDKFGATGWNRYGMPVVSQPATDAGSRERTEREELEKIRDRRAQRLICIYSEDELVDLKQMNVRIHAVADDVEGWTFHVRDEAQSLIKGTGGRLKTLRHELQNSYPAFYGLSMCISATLMPVFAEPEVVGSTDSIRQLFNRAEPHNGVVTRRSALEKNVVLQHWSFPIAPDYLTPPRGAYPLSSLENDTAQEWYRGHFEGAPRTTHYYGTHFHVVAWSNQHLTSQVRLMLDGTLHHEIRRCNNAVRESLNLRQLSKDYKLENAYFEYLKSFNAVNKRYFDAHAGAWREGPTTRIANAPISKLTRDASRIVEQAQAWLDDPPQATEQGESTLHPMLILAPAREQALKNGRQEWAVMLCKVAWLRMHEAYERDAPAFRDKYGKDRDGERRLREDYGINVLVYASDRTQDAYVDLVCQERDFTPQKDGLVLCVVFDPTLRENRLPVHTFDWDLDGGVMLRSILVPELHPSNFEDYAREVGTSRLPQPDPDQGADAPANRAVRTATSAAAYLRDHVVLTTYTFDAGTFYGVEANVPAPAAAASPSDGASAEMDEADAEGGQDPVQSQPGVPDDPDVADDSPAPSIVNVNAVALRLCVSQHANAQAAIRSIFDKCRVSKVAATGHAMFSAGLTLQTTFAESNAHTRLFVPKYMSLWISDRDNGPDLSALYQLVGRGFVDMKQHQLPPDWKLQLLGQPSLQQLIEEYGDAELIASMVHNESLEGRRMTLGATLWTAGPDALAEGYGDKRLKGDEPRNTLMRVLFHNSKPERNATHQRVFGKVRECLVGTYAATTRACLTNRERRLEHWDRAFEDDREEITLRRHEVGPGEELPVGTRGNNLDGDDSLCGDEDATPAPPQVAGASAAPAPAHDPHDIPPGWYFDAGKEVALRARLDRARQRARDREAEVARRVKAERQALPGQQDNALEAQLADEVDGRNLRLRIAAREFDRDNKWDRKALAEEIVSEQGRYEGLFDWYLGELRVAEEKRHIKTGKTDRIAPPVDVPKPRRRLGASDRSVRAYMSAAERAHKEVLARSDQWVRTFCTYVKEYLLDLEHGPETSRDAQWCQHRSKFLGAPHGYSEAHERRWSALRLRLAQVAVSDADVARMGELLHDAQAATDTHTPGMPWDAFVAALGKVLSPKAVLAAWVALQTERQREKVDELQRAAAIPDNAAADDDSFAGGSNPGEQPRGATPGMADGDAAMQQAPPLQSPQQGGVAEPAQDDSDSDSFGIQDPDQAKASIARKKARDAAAGKLRKRQVLDPADFPAPTEPVALSQPRKGPRSTASLGNLPAQSAEEQATWTKWITSVAARKRGDDDVAVGGGALTDRFKETLTVRHLRTLMPGKWLNDTIINTYLELLQQRSDTRSTTSNPILRCHFFKTLFFRQLFPTGGNLANTQGAVPGSAFQSGGAVKEEYDFLKVASHTADVKVFEQDMIFIPVSFPEHWCLIVVNFEEKQVEYFDPLGGEGTRELAVARQWLKHAWKQKQMSARKGDDPLKEWDDAGWTYISWRPEMRGVPEQHDGWNCGMFLLMTADYYSQGAFLDYHERQADWVNILRCRILHAVLMRRLPGAPEPPPPTSPSADGQISDDETPPQPPPKPSMTVEESLMRRISPVTEPASPVTEPAPSKGPSPPPRVVPSPSPLARANSRSSDDGRPRAPAAATQQTEPPASQQASQASDATQPPEHASAAAMADMASAIAEADSYWEHISTPAQGSEWARVLEQMHALAAANTYDGDLLARLKALNKQTREADFKDILDRNLGVTGPRARKPRVQGADYPDNSAPQLASKKPRQR
jgi:sentrin-specific protease 1